MIDTDEIVLKPLIGEEEYLNRGIGKMIIRKLEEKIIELGGREIAADPSEEKCGFNKGAAKQWV